MQLDCSDKKIYRLIFDRQEITSGVTHRAHRSLWAHFKVNPKVYGSEVWYMSDQISKNQIQNWFSLFQQVWGKEKAFSGRQPKRRQTKNKYIFIVTRKRAFVNV